MAPSTSLSKRMLTLFVAILMAVSAVGMVLPSSAQAEENGSISTQATDPVNWYLRLKTYDISMVAGTQDDLMKNVVEAYGIDPEGSLPYHLDFLVDKSYGDSSCISVNKHSGMLTALKTGEARVAICLVAADRPAQGQPGSQDPTKPDGEVVVTAYLTVTVTQPGATDYGFQGGTNAVKMTAPLVTSWKAVENGYQNELANPIQFTDGGYKFVYETTAGFTSFNTPQGYASTNAGNIVLLNDKGVQVGVLNAANTGALTVQNTDNNTKQITLKVDPDEISEDSESGRYQLVFKPELRANNANRVLGTTLTFDFAI